MLKRAERKVVREVCLCSLVILVLLISVDMAIGGNVDVALCTLIHPPGVDAGEIPVMQEIIEGAADLQSFDAGGLGDLADWVKLIPAARGTCSYWQVYCQVAFTRLETVKPMVLSWRSFWTPGTPS